ncbi:MAG: fluoride efflux transporter CrcB [Labrys sp. (in: a-proteobacteria)]
MMPAVLSVFLGAGLGGVLRYLLGQAVTAFAGPGFPWGTFVINVSGCVLMGFLARVIPAPEDGGQSLRLLLMTGVLGGFTTYSAFALDAANLWMRDDIGASLAYVGGTLILCLVGVAIGLSIGRWVAAS